MKMDRNLWIKRYILFILSLTVMALPSRVKIYIYRRLFGYKIGKNVKIGLSWINVGKADIGNNVVISHLTRFKNIPEMIIGNYSIIGPGNTFTSTYEFYCPERIAAKGNKPALIIGDHVGIAQFNYFDVQDLVSIGSFTTIAGRGSVIFTHFLEIITATQSTKPVSVGNYCMIGSSVRIVPGAVIPSYSVVGMGTVVTKAFAETHCFLAGNPAKVVSRLPEDAAYFSRTQGWIGTYSKPPYARVR